MVLRFLCGQGQKGQKGHMPDPAVVGGDLERTPLTTTAVGFLSRDMEGVESCSNYYLIGSHTFLSVNVRQGPSNVGTRGEILRLNGSLFLTPPLVTNHLPLSNFASCTPVDVTRVTKRGAT